jgi:putative NADH-flavin reductase
MAEPVPGLRSLVSYLGSAISPLNRHELSNRGSSDQLTYCAPAEQFSPMLKQQGNLTVGTDELSLPKRRLRREL